MSESNGIDWKAKCEEYERRMGIGAFDPAKDGYLVLVNILRQQNDFLQSFVIKNKISSEEKVDTIAYKNASDLWEKLPGFIQKVNSLKIELKMEGEEKKSVYSPISAKEIANGNV
jgi:hypothetical protein